MLNEFIQSCKNVRDKDGQPGYIGLFHKLYPELISYITKNNIHFIDEEYQTIQISNKYKLSRNL